MAFFWNSASSWFWFFFLRIHLEILGEFLMGFLRSFFRDCFRNCFKLWKYLQKIFQIFPQKLVHEFLKEIRQCFLCSLDSIGKSRTDMSMNIYRKPSRSSSSNFDIITLSDSGENLEIPAEVHTEIFTAISPEYLLRIYNCNKFSTDSLRN